VKILLTGLSSHTGAWFAAALARAGHAVTGTLQRASGDYAPLQQQRIDMARAAGVAVAECVTYGGAAFRDLAGLGFDLIGWHGAHVGDHRSPDFDIAAALARTTEGMAAALSAAREGGAARVIYTGSIAEPGEGGADGEPERAMSRYGLAKHLAWETLRAAAIQAGLSAGRFVVANPFGPLEKEDSFTTYLVRSWAAGQTPEVRTPCYVRDNIPVDLLALAYACFAGLALDDPAAMVCRPSGYAGPQGEFAARFAAELGPRLGLPTPLALADQTGFPEPRQRINSDPVAGPWDEAGSWDRLAADYAKRILADSARR